MGDTVIVTEDEPKPPPTVVVVPVEKDTKVDKVVTEKTTIVETRRS